MAAQATRDAVRRTLDAAGKQDVAISSELGCVTPWLVAGGGRQGGEEEPGQGCTGSVELEPPGGVPRGPGDQGEALDGSNVVNWYGVGKVS